MKKLTSDEEAIIKSVESGEWKSKGNIDGRIKALQASIKNQKKTAISIRLAENDIYELKKKALEHAVPYQTIVQMLIHQYASNKIKLTM